MRKKDVKTNVSFYIFVVTFHPLWASLDEKFHFMKNIGEHYNCK